MQEESAKEALRRRQNKVKRVKHIKNAIKAFALIYLIGSLCLIGYLLFSVYSLKEQVSQLKKTSIAEKTETGSSADAESDFSAVDAYGAEDEDNLADPDDTLKVYLTFDDGPSSNTGKILDILDDYSVKATFFVNGKTDSHSLKMYKRIVKEGHTIGMHSYTHDYSQVYASLDSFKDDLKRIQDLIYKETGVMSDLYRFPGGSSNQVSDTDMSVFIKYLNEQGITYFDWNVMSGDATNEKITQHDIIENVMNDVVKYKTSVVLMHDAANKDNTVKALPKLIEKLQSKGAVLLPITKDTTLVQHVTIKEDQ